MRPHLETPFPNVDRSVYCVCYERRGSPRRSWCLWRRCRSLAAWRFGTFPSFRPTAYTRPGSMSTPPLGGMATKPGGISWSPVRFPAQAERRGRRHGQHGDIHDHARGNVRAKIRRHMSEFFRHVFGVDEADTLRQESRQCCASPKTSRCTSTRGSRPHAGGS